MYKENKMNLNEEHKLYGKCIAMRTIEGEPYRFFIKDGSVSMIPLDVLERENNEN
jgi:hypothetical protein